MLATGTYQHTTPELTFGARVAWRDSAGCVGRLDWRGLTVRDLRVVRDADRVAAQCVRHLQLATNGGRIRPMISVFAPDAPGAPGPRIWNERLIAYAGHRQCDGTVLGDPRYVHFTDTVCALGWRPPEPAGEFDVLPLMVSTAHEDTRLYRIEPAFVLEVPLAHPELEWFADLGLRWHALPSTSDMRLRIGGVTYPAAPFNGWYLGTEIGTGKLADADGYHQLPIVAHRLGLDMSSDRTLWRDRAAIEINRAVLHSFAEAGVTITDHHTQARRFLAESAKAEKADRMWITPPISGSLSSVFHRYCQSASGGPEFLPPIEATC